MRSDRGAECALQGDYEKLKIVVLKVVCVCPTHPTCYICTRIDTQTLCVRDDVLNVDSIYQRR